MRGKTEKEKPIVYRAEIPRRFKSSVGMTAETENKKPTTDYSKRKTLRLILFQVGLDGRQVQCDILL